MPHETHLRVVWGGQRQTYHAFLYACVCLAANESTYFLLSLQFFMSFSVLVPSFFAFLFPL